MRILIAADTYYPNSNGASYFTQRLAVLLKERGHKILVLAPSRNKQSEYYNHDGIDILGIFSLPSGFHKNYRFSPPFFITPIIKKAFLKFQPDIVHIQGHFFIESSAASVAHTFHIPILGTNHFMPENLIHYLHAPKQIEKILINIGWKKFCKVFEKIDFITTPTQSAAELLKHIGLQKNVTPVSCGIDLQRFQPRPANEALRTKLGLPNTALLLSVGRLAPEKNIDCILKAIAQIPKKQAFHFALAGIGEEKDKLQQLSKLLHIEKKVTFLGFVTDEDLPNIYNLASGFVIAGTAELQCIAALEAMASGLPILAANAVALPELVKNNENGYIFEPGNSKQLAEQIEKLFSDKKIQKQFAEKNLQKIQAHNITRTIDTFENIYQNLLKKKE